MTTCWRISKSIPFVAPSAPGASRFYIKPPTCSDSQRPQRDTTFGVLRPVGPPLSRTSTRERASMFSGTPPPDASTECGFSRSSQDLNGHSHPQSQHSPPQIPTPTRSPPKQSSSGYSGAIKSGTAGVFPAHPRTRTTRPASSRTPTRDGQSISVSPPKGSSLRAVSSPAPIARRPRAVGPDNESGGD